MKMWRILCHLKTVRNADMLFAIGGGKATDTVKTLADMTGKPVFTFPTIASNCSSCTSVSIMYKNNGIFLKPHFFFLPIRDSGMYLTTIVCTGISFFTRFLLFLFWWLDDHAADWISHRRKLLFILRHDIPLRILAMMQVKRIVDHLPTGKFYLFQ